MNGIHVRRSSCARIPTEYGEFQLCLYNNSLDDKEHLALIMGEPEAKSGVMVRIHSECFTGDVLGSRRCDCGEQLELSMRMIADQGEGVIVYLRQEGRGIGLLDKLRAYNLQDEGYDTVEANLLLGHTPDEREYTLAVAILRDLRIRSVQLITNNPHKIMDLKNKGLTVSGRIPVPVTVTKENARYLETKRKRLNHKVNTELVMKPYEREPFSDNHE